MTIEFDGQNNKLGTTTADSVTIKTNDTDALTVDSNQNVGVGTTTPTNFGSNFKMLAVEGSDFGVVQSVSNSGSVTTEMMASSTVGFIGTRTNHPFVLRTNDTERCRIDSSGDFLVAKTSEGLSNNGVELRTTGQILATSTGDAGLFYRKTSSTGAGVILTYSDVGGTESLVGAGYANGTFGAVSDINKKKNVENARNYLDDLMQIRVVKYNWKTDEDDAPKELGWIAQEVAEVFPAMVSEIDGNVLLKKEVFLPMMLKSIQELKEYNDSLETKVENLESTVADLTTRLEALENV